MLDDTPAYLKSWIDNWELLSQFWRVGLVIFGLVLGTALTAFIVSRVIAKLETRFMRSNNLWDDAFLHALRKPAIGFVWLQGVFWAAEIAYRYSEAEILSANEIVLQLGFVWLMVWTLLGVIKQGEYLLASPVKMEQPLDYTTVNAISKLLRAVVIITAVLIVLQTMGFSISGVLAFGGVGGIAVGFAAKDLLANFFGGFIVHLDRPFKVGDWIRSPDRNIEGTVEEIGWRLTTIRTFDKRPLYVPNAVFTQVAVENPSRMTNRRIFETIGIRYADMAQMRAIVEDIRAMLDQHEDIDTSQTLIVNFLGFSESSLDIMVYTFTRTTEWVRYHHVKQDVLLKINDIIGGYQAEVAFPTRTLHLPDGVRVSGDEQGEEGADPEGEEAQFLARATTDQKGVSRSGRRRKPVYSGEADQDPDQNQTGDEE